MRKLRSVFFIFLGILSSNVFAKSKVPGHVPDEIESDGGHMLGFSYGGSAAVSGQGSIRSNPSMLVFEKQYLVSGGYHWPTLGREFYQVGVIDSKTSNFSAGFVYTSFRERYRNPLDPSSDVNELNSDENMQAFYDSPIKNRISFALAQAFSKLSGGLGVQIVNSAIPTESKRGVTLGLGLAGLLTPNLRFGASAENLANRSVKNIAPTVYRGGLAYVLFNGDLTCHLDYRQRERVVSELTTPTLVTPDNSFSTFEKMAILSSSVRIQDLLRILVGYGKEIGGERSSLSGGLALVNKNFSFSYLLGKPYLSDSHLHQAVNLEFQLAF